MKQFSYTWRRLQVLAMEQQASDFLLAIFSLLTIGCNSMPFSQHFHISLGASCSATLVAPSSYFTKDWRPFPITFFGRRVAFCWLDQT